MPGRPRISYAADGLVSRSEIRALYGVSYPTVIKWATEGRFGEPIPNPKDTGRVFYSKTTVEENYMNWRPRASAWNDREKAIRDNTLGELTAAVFLCMKQGKQFADIVIETKAEAPIVRRIMDEYDKDHFYLRKLEEEKEFEKAQKLVEVERYRDKRQEKYWDRRTELEIAKIKTEAKQKARSTESNAPRSRVQMPEFLTKKS